MSAIGEIITGSDLKAIQQLNSRIYSTRAYVAPTVYRYATNNTTSWKYYTTLAQAIQQFYYLKGIKGYTAATPAGTVSFKNEAKAQTLGINVDFFIDIPIVGTCSIPYEFLRTKMGENLIIPFRFYKTDGSGPYYSILLNSALGISATVVYDVAASKIQALDIYHRELQLLKAKYNTLALYLNDLSKRTLKPAQQQSFNEGLLLMNNMREEIRKIKGIDITYTTSGQIAEPITLLTILLISIIAGVIGWTATKIATEAANVKKMNAAFDMQKWIAEQKLKLATALKAGGINKSEYESQVASLDKANAVAQKVVSDVTANEPGILDKATNILLIGGGIFLASKFIK